MPTIQGIPGFQLITSSANPTQGIPYTRFKGVALSGTIGDSVTSGPGPVPPAGGFVCIQSTASISNQVVTTSATGYLNASWVYIPVTSATAANWIGLGAPAYTGCGAPVVWNDATKTLQVWSSGSSSWMTGALLTSGSTSGAAATAQPVIFTTS